MNRHGAQVEFAIVHFAQAEAFEAATAYGVMGMRERAGHFGGRIAIASELGSGSSFTLLMPLPTRSPEGDA